MSQITSTPSTSTEASQSFPGGVCVITYEPLDVDAIVHSVGDDGAGATAVFIGTTRNSFKGRQVVRLDYQAYSKLAIKTMTDIVQSAQRSVCGLTPHNHAAPSSSQPQPETAATCASSPSPLLHTALYHRLGTVPVGQPSIVIAVSSPHRKEAFVACEYILEEVKSRVQIWKREFYEGEKDEPEWKANAC